MLPSDMLFIERGWLSSNSLLLLGGDDPVLIDSGYYRHADQTIALLKHALKGRPLRKLFNTHLHSDHCGGNAAVQTAWPAVQTSIPPGLSLAVKQWDEAALSYRPTGQICPQFSFQSTLQPGTSLVAGGYHWRIHAAPGHDPDAILLFQPDTAVLLTADALWENGFGVVFPEIQGEPGFSDVADTLDLIESLKPRLVIPGHGRYFTDIPAALQRARERLHIFVHSPTKHASHAAKVLLKFRMMDQTRCPISDLCNWASSSEYLHCLHSAYFANLSFEEWTNQMLTSLIKIKALVLAGEDILDV